MPIDVNVTINPSLEVVARLTTMEGELLKMSESLTHLTEAVAAEEATSGKIVGLLGTVVKELQELRAGGGATPAQLDALAARIASVTQAEQSAVQSVPAEDLPPASPEIPPTQ